MTCDPRGAVGVDVRSPCTPGGDRVEAVLEERFGIPIVVVIRTERQFRAVVRKAPDGFGAQPDRYHSDAVFLKAPLTAAQAAEAI